MVAPTRTQQDQKEDSPEQVLLKTLIDRRKAMVHTIEPASMPDLLMFNALSVAIGHLQRMDKDN